MRSRWLPAVLVLATWAFALAVYPSLPERVPTHWSVQGEVDGWSSRAFGAFLPPAIATLVWALLTFLPRLDPRRENYEKFGGDYRFIVTLVVAFLAVMEVATLGYALGWPVDVGGVVMAGVGLLLAGMGNYLPRVRPNWWIGVRTPWTLESDRVWRATHRVAGRVFVVGGLVLAAVALLAPDPVRGWAVLPLILTVALVPAVYSYLEWRREKSDTM